MAYLVPETARQLQNRLVAWLEANLIDPYEQAKSTTRAGFVDANDYATGFPPRLQVSFQRTRPTRATMHKHGYLEEEQHDFIIYYSNQKSHRFTFASLSNMVTVDEAQNSEYLAYVRRTLKANITAFDGYFHKHAFGDVSRAVFNPKTNLFVGMLPFTVFTYRR